MSEFNNEGAPRSAKSSSERMRRKTERMPAMTRKSMYVALCAVLCAAIAHPVAAATSVTQISYTAGDQVAKVIDPRGLITTYTYDGLGQLWQQASPDTGTTSYSYDTYGRRSSMTRADNTQTTYGYDSLNRASSISAGGLTQTFTYDGCTNGIGRLCALNDGTGTTSYAYSPEGWLLGRSFSISGMAYALGYSYDAMGHLASVSYPDGRQAIYSYDDGVVSGVTLNIDGNVITGATSVTYRPGDTAMSGWTSSNGLVNTLSYDTDGRLAGLSVTNLQSLSIAYDAANRVASITNGIDPSQSENYNYDDQSRLTGAYGTANTESYSYDVNGNRTSQTINGAGATFSISSTNNRLTGVNGVATATYGHDPQGNLTQVNGTTTYQFDAFNRLKLAGTASDYVSPEGVRLRKVSDSGVIYFAPQDGALLAENGNGVWTDYVWLNGRLIGRLSGGTVDAVHTDQVGRPQVVTDSNGTMVWLATNYPFERAVALDDIGGLNLGFPGQYYDVDRGLWNNGYRDYNSSLGRYIESDPIGLAAGVNTYLYVGGNPVADVDPIGLATLCQALEDLNKRAQASTSPYLKEYPDDPFNPVSRSMEDVPFEQANYMNESGAEFDIQYFQVGWAAVKNYGAVYGPALAATATASFDAGVRAYSLTNSAAASHFRPGNISANWRGLGMGVAAALKYDKFGDYVNANCGCK